MKNKFLILVLLFSIFNVAKAHDEFTQRRFELHKQKSLFLMDQLEGFCSKDKSNFLMDLIFENNLLTIVEIGVFGGKSLIPMAFALKGMQKGIIYGIDPWDIDESIQGISESEATFWKEVNHEEIYQDLLKKIKNFSLEYYVTLVRSTSKKATAIQNIDLLHIDGNPSKEASLLDVHKWVSFVKNGGFVIYSDLTSEAAPYVMEYLDSTCVRTTKCHNDNTWLIWQKP